MAVNFSSNNNFNATQNEVVAFQEKTSYTGCGGGFDCSERPGDAHSFPYFDDRNQTVMYDWNERYAYLLHHFSEWSNRLESKYQWNTRISFCGFWNAFW